MPVRPMHRRPADRQAHPVSRHDLHVSSAAYFTFSDPSERAEPAHDLGQGEEVGDVVADRTKLD
jgi:hypothetical protein